MLVVARGFAAVRCCREARVGERHDERAHRVADREADVTEERAVEVVDALGAVRVLGGFHLAQHERMAAHCTLTKDDEAAREDVRAFDGDGHGYDLVAAGEIVLGSEADALAAVHVHRVVGDLPRHLGDVVLQHRGGHRGFLAAVDGPGGDRARRVHGVGEAHHASDHALDALELADRHVELSADAGIGAGREHRGLAATGAARGQRDAAPDGELLDQHAPALARHLRSADDEVERHEHIRTGERTVLERHIEREVPAADGDARCLARDQRAGDAEVLLAAEQPLGVEHAEGEADHRRHGRKRDVALGEVQAQSGDLATLPDPFADHAAVGERSGVGAGARSGEREAGDVIAAREPRQVVVLLLLGAVVLQQLAGAERVRHRDRRGHRGAAGRELGEHAGVRVGRELEAAVLLLDDHREEALALQEVPDLRRHVAAAMRDVEIVDHPAQLFAGAVEESLLFGRELRRLGAEQLRPVRLAGEELAVPPHGARLERLALGVGHRGQHAPVHLQERTRQHRLAQRPDVEEHQQRRARPQDAAPPQRWLAEHGVRDQQRQRRRREGEQVQALVGEVQQRRHEQQRDPSARERERPDGETGEQEGDECVCHGGDPLGGGVRAASSLLSRADL